MTHIDNGGGPKKINRESVIFAFSQKFTTFWWWWWKWQNGLYQLPSAFIFKSRRFVNNINETLHRRMYAPSITLMVIAYNLLLVAATIADWFSKFIDNTQNLGSLWERSEGWYWGGAVLPFSNLFLRDLTAQLDWLLWDGGSSRSVSLPVIFCASSLLHPCLAARVTILCPQWRQSLPTVIPASPNGTQQWGGGAALNGRVVVGRV